MTSPTTSTVHVTMSLPRGLAISLIIPTARIGLCESMFSLPKYKKLCRVSCRVLEYSHFFSDADCMQLLRQPDAQPYEIVCLPENP